jgi:hypothetical protein
MLRPDRGSVTIFGRPVARSPTPATTCGAESATCSTPRSATPSGGEESGGERGHPDPDEYRGSAAGGYLPAVAALILIVVATQILTVIGVGAWVPYAATSLWAGMGGPEAAATIAPQHLALIPLTAAAGVAATLWWWRRMQVV